ncbi:tigger transposable element-derived protein 1-like isoform X2 [Homarus americanus]|uniref:tigger transposable element-derived protein 1-like isoform X2 n=1 Tax=Homarus americanus TaxID=6706 RepID=UPI001C452C90|nr:tigger transposable element-derived protein 1-like isoform X2 [Homarus americanus]
MSEKRPSSASEISRAKRARKGITLDIKLDVLRRFDAGEKLTQISKTLGLATSTVGSIRYNRDKIKSSAQAATPLTARTLYFHRSHVMLNMERLLSAWIEDQTQRNVLINTMIIQEKAKSLYNDLQKKEDATSEAKHFQASKGWFERFKKRHNLHAIKTICEAASPDTEATRKYPDELKKIIDEGGYTPEQVYNVDETELYWKRLPATTFICKEEKSASGFKASKDHLTVLLGGNAAGDMKLKPLLVYHSENPRAFKGYAKSNLLVIWRSNKKAWMTIGLFQDWFTNYFCPAVERYSDKHNISNKALLLLDNAPSHPVNLNDLSNHVRVEYIPKNTTALLQPMNQGVITKFKAYYLRRTFKQLLKAIDGEDKPTVRDFWRKFNIMDAAENIAESWDEVTPSVMNGVWKNIWPECTHDFHSFPQAESIHQIQQDIVTLANDVGFAEVIEDDVVELLQSHRGDLSNEDLMLLEQERAAGEEEATEAPPTPLQLTTKQMAKGFALIEEGLQIFAANDPNRERSLKVARAVRNGLSCYNELHKEKMCRKHQKTIFTATTPVSQQEASTKKKHRTKDQRLKVVTTKQKTSIKSLEHTYTTKAEKCKEVLEKHDSAAPTAGEAGSGWLFGKALKEENINNNVDVQKELMNNVYTRQDNLCSIIKEEEASDVCLEKDDLNRAVYLEINTETVLSAKVEDRNSFESIKKKHKNTKKGSADNVVFMVEKSVKNEVVNNEDLEMHGILSTQPGNQLCTLLMKEGSDGIGDFKEVESDGDVQQQQFNYICKEEEVLDGEYVY